MARLASIATGNFTAAGTWGLVDDTSYLDSEAGSTASTTSLVYSSTFTPGAITVDGIAVKVASRTASPTGTVTVGLYLNAGSTLVDSATLNATDIANTNSGVAYNRGWYFFKFAAPQLLVAATAYKVGFVTSVTGTVTIYRDATAGNWSRMLRTTTTQAPAASDQLHLIGEHTGAGTGNSFTVTMDNTASTSFGPTVSGGPPQGITLGKRGTFTCGTTASTAYVLKWKGIFSVHDAGTLNLGTSGTPMPSTSSLDAIMDSVANVDTGFDFGHGATVNIYGDAKFTTTFKSLLNTDEAAAQTVLGIVATTGWANGDEIYIASTSQTFSQCEKRTITTVDSGTQVTVSSGLTNAHSGTSPTQAEVGNLTRNIKIHGIGTNQPSVTTTLQGYINIAALAVVTIRYAQFYYLGSATANKRGFDVATTTGTFDVQYCSIHDGWITSSRGVNVSSASGSSITFSNNVTFNVNDAHFTNVATTGTQVLDNDLFCLNVGGFLVNLVDAGTTLTNCTLVGGAFQGLRINETSAVLGTNSGNTVHSCTGNSNIDVTVRGGTFTNLTWWRCGSTNGGLSLLTSCNSLIFNSPIAFGNSTANFMVLSGTSGVGLEFNNLVSNGDTTFATTTGFHISSVFDATFNDCDFSSVSGIKTAHTNDFLIVAANSLVRITLRNTKLGGTNEVATPSNFQLESFIGSQKHDQTAGSHKTWMQTGITSIDTALFRTSSPSARLTPTSAGVKLPSAPKQYGFTKKVDSGGTITANIYVRKSKTSTGDATTYNGNHPRLIVRRNVAAGISADTVLATATSASEGAWELLTGTTAAVTDDAVLEFIVDCDGTTGWVNIDDFS